MFNFRSTTAIILVSIILAQCTRESQTPAIQVSGRQVLIDDQPFLIKGICYHPVAKGSIARSFETLEGDLALMQEAGINTIRVYSPIDDKKVLDKIHAAGIKLITGFGYNQNGHYDILSGSFIDYIKTYKNHPAILFWELGNEYNYHPEWFGGDLTNWYNAMNDAAAKIHATDPLHPVATAHGELPDSLALAKSHNIDIWGMNVYRWDNPEEIFAQWAAVSNKPMYLAEAGGDSYMAESARGYEKGSNEKAQADATQNILESIFRNREICSGVTLFSFSDEWWKAGNPGTQEPGGWAPQSSGVPYDGAANEEYWGIVDIDRNKKQAFGVVKEFYKKHKQ
jgi:exo-beta-1,3-glucanase (GH17 family)